MKRLGSFLLALVMLCTLVPSAFAAQTEQYHFTASTEPAEIYATILRDYSETWAESYKHSLLFYTNAVNGDDVNEIDTDSHEIGPKDQYPWEARRAAIQSMSSIINNAEQVPMYADPEAQVFDDVVPGTWYYEAINAMAAGGLLTGYDDGLFHPDDVITVAQMATVMCKIYGIPMDWTWTDVATFSVDEVIKNADGTLTVFGDIANNGGRHYYEDGYKYHWGLAAQLNWSYSRDTYVPLAHEYLDKPVIRAQVLNEMVVLYLDKYGRSFIENFDKTSPDAITLDDIPDANIIEIGPSPSGKGGEMPILPAGFNNDPDLWAANHSWTYHRILWAYNMGITNGVDNNLTCDPYGFVTRAQFCQMLYNLGITTADSVELPTMGGLFGGSN